CGALSRPSAPRPRELVDGRGALPRRPEQRSRAEALPVPRDRQHGGRRLRSLDAGSPLLLQLTAVRAATGRARARLRLPRNDSQDIAVFTIRRRSYRLERRLGLLIRKGGPMIVIVDERELVTGGFRSLFGREGIASAGFRAREF